jgi:hypothetical protein
MKMRKGVNKQCTTQSDALAIPNQSEVSFSFIFATMLQI